VSVLGEVPAAQVPGEPRRRWFVDDYFDVVVWLSPAGEAVALELCYGKPRDERAITWSAGQGYRHFRVDAGEDTPLSNRSPILLPAGAFPRDDLVARFRERAAQLDPEIRDFVIARLERCPTR
jgi:hypothetical protein